MTTYTLAAPRPPADVPRLDTSQQAVLAHDAGPLLVLAGPGTGKTTTLVELVVDLVERRGVAPDQVLALTFSRKAADSLRDRVTARLGRTLGSSLSATFHSFAYSLVRRHAPVEAYAAPLRLLSAPQADVVVRRLLEPTPEAVDWPDALAPARRTRGFAREVQMLLARARERGLDPVDMVTAGKAADRPEWVAGGRFLEQYLDVLDAESALDYADLVTRAAGLAARPEVQRDLRARYQWVLVDEYQDTDPSQVALLRALAGEGRNLVVVGDPDQSIYGFRGAEVRGILDFPDEFRTRAGERAPVVALQTTRRFGPRLLTASRRIAATLPTTGAIPADAFRAFREPVPVEGPLGPGRVEVRHYDTARAEVEHVADLLRRAHLEDEVPWSEMAVLVRSGRASIPTLRRNLVAAGVPVEVGADDTPLVAESGTQPLLDALSAALHLDTTDPQDPQYVDAERAESLLLSPLGGLDAAEIRLMARALHRREKQQVLASGGRPRSSRELVRCAVLDPSLLDALPSGRGTDKVRRLAALLRRAAALATAGATAEEVLWTLWSDTRWPEQLRASATSGGSGAMRAHRDLDAIVALFEEAAKAEEQRGHTTAEVFLETLSAQQIPSDSLADRGVRGQAVRLITAHRSKGLEWRLVVLHGVQEGAWPDLRRRSTLLASDRLGAEGELPAVETRALLAEERRLFYVACTRARQRLVVTAVASPDDDGEQPSRFLAELGKERELVQGRPRRPLTLDGLVAELRRTVADPATTDAVRRAAALRLARLADVRLGAGPGDTSGSGSALVPAADPDRWWGLRDWTVAAAPVRDPDAPLSVSASMLDGLLTCPTQWFLSREAGGVVASSQAQGFGNVVHTLVDRVVQGDFGEPAGVGVDTLMEHVSAVWGQIAFRTPWSSVKEYAEVRDALSRYLTWQTTNPRTHVASEQSFTVDVEVGGTTVRLNGFADRVEVDSEGRVVVVDFKTSKNPPRASDVRENAQLGLYQLAAEAGAFREALGREAEPGGAELVQLRQEVGGRVKVQEQAPQQPDETGRRPVEVQIESAVRRVRDETFPAVEGAHCRYCAFALLCPTKTSGSVMS